MLELTSIENKIDESVVFVPENITDLIFGSINTSPNIVPNVKNGKTALAFGREDMAGTYYQYIQRYNGGLPLPELTSVLDEFTITMVFSRELSNTYGELLYAEYENSPDFFNIAYIDSDILNFSTWHTEFVEEISSTKPISSPGMWNIVSISRNGQNLKMYVNGALDSTVSSLSTTAYYTLTADHTLFRVGEFGGYMGDFLLSNVSMPDEQIIELHNFLNSKWNITAELSTTNSFYPNCPKNIYGVNTDYDSITVGWDDIPEVTSYNVKVNYGYMFFPTPPLPDPVVIDIATAETATSQATITGLAPNTQYNFFVWANNDFGNSGCEPATVYSISTLSPTAIHGLKLWLDADQYTMYDSTSGGNLVALGQPIARWEDKSGNGNHAIQSVNGSRPKQFTDTLPNGIYPLGGVAVNTITFDGGDSLNVTGLSSNSLSASNLTYFAVIKRTGTGTNPLIIGNADTTQGKARDMYLSSANNYSVGYKNDSDAAIGYSAHNNFISSPNILNEYEVWSVNLDNGTAQGLEFYKNGQRIHTLPQLYNNLTTANAALKIGTNFVGVIGELLVYNTTLDVDDIITMHKYLCLKWKVSMPSSDDIFNTILRHQYDANDSRTYQSSSRIYMTDLINTSSPEFTAMGINCSLSAGPHSSRKTIQLDYVGTNGAVTMISPTNANLQDYTWIRDKMGYVVSFKNKTSGSGSKNVFNAGGFSLGTVVGDSSKLRAATTNYNIPIGGVLYDWPMSVVWPNDINLWHTVAVYFNDSNIRLAVDGIECLSPTVSAFGAENRYGANLLGIGGYYSGSQYLASGIYIGEIMILDPATTYDPWTKILEAEQDVRSRWV